MYICTRELANGAKITWIQDNFAPKIMPVSLFENVDPSLIESMGLQDGIPASTSAFLLETDRIRILFDTGYGAEDSILPTALTELGVACEDIDYICLTHLHRDHIGGLVRNGMPAFPCAQVFISRTEYEAWMNLDSGKNVYQREVFTAYDDKIQLVEDNATIIEDIVTIPAYGHTPGHTVYRYDNLLVVGDIMHGVAIQLTRPDICASYDADKLLTVASRKRILNYASQHNLMMAGSHFPPPTFL